MVICNGNKFKSLQEFLMAEMEWLYRSGKTYSEISEIFGMSMSWSVGTLNHHSKPNITPQVEKGLERLGYRIIIEPVKGKVI